MGKLLPYRVTSPNEFDLAGVELSPGMVVLIDLGRPPRFVVEGWPEEAEPVHSNDIEYYMQMGWFEAVPAKPAKPKPVKRGPMTEAEYQAKLHKVLRTLLKHPRLALDVTGKVRSHRFAGPWEDGEDSPQDGAVAVRPIVHHPRYANGSAVYVTRGGPMRDRDWSIAIKDSDTPIPFHGSLDAAKEHADFVLTEEWGWFLVKPPPKPLAYRGIAGPWQYVSNQRGENWLRALPDHRDDRGRPVKGSPIAHVNSRDTWTDRRMVEWTVYPKGRDEAAEMGEVRARKDDSVDLDRAIRDAKTKVDNILREHGWTLR